MRKIKRFLIIVLLVLFFGIFSGNKASANSLVPLVINDKNINYYGTQTQVMIPSEYIPQEREFRAAWVSRYVSDIGNLTSEIQFKNSYLAVLDQLEEYNMNAIIFHVRTHHDAFYRSSLNKQSGYVGNVNQYFDSLAWAIEETHKRGIEFHAWLNPYRIKSSGSVKYESLVAEYAAFPDNPVHNPDNVLFGSGVTILNPGEPEVREFLIDTVMELIENYDVDAIHFDDYFYADGVNDSKTYNKPGYNPKKLSLADWRREQVDIFIRDLSQAIRDFNVKNNRYVQLGISPTGIYKNASRRGFAYGIGFNDYHDVNGNFITSGSNTAGFQHSGDYLYADTKKWIDNEWIDYILPQTYWGFTRAAAPYADLVEWWANVVKYKKVNLYTGIGIYMASSGATDDSWRSNPYEIEMQIRFNSKIPEIKGASIYSLKQIKSQVSQYPGLEILKNDMWNTKVLRPIIGTIARDPLGKIPNASIQTQGNKNILTWDNIPGARGYVIYRSTGKINFDDSSQIYQILGVDTSEFPVFEDIVEVGKTYNYGIRAIDGANQLGEGTLFGTEKVYYNVTVSDNVNNTLLSVLNSRVLFGTPNSVYVNNSNPNYRFMFLTEGNKVISQNTNYTFYTVQNVHYKGYFVHKNKIGVAFVDSNNDLLKFQEVNDASEIAPPTIPQEQNDYRFSHWSYPLDKVTEDIIIRAIYVKDDRPIYKVTIFDGVNTITKQVPYGTKLTLSIDQSFANSFNHWKIDGVLASFDKEYTISVYQDLNIEASSTNIAKQPIAFIFNKGVKTGEGVAFVGRFYLPTGVEFVEAGMLLYESNSTNFDFDTPNVIRVKALKFSNNNEFSVIKRTVDVGTTINAKVYLMYLQDGKVHTILSETTQYKIVNVDYETLSSIVSQVPRHIIDDYTFPTYPGLEWGYAEGEDESLFDIENGKLLVQRVTTQVRVIEARYKGIVMTLEINFGITGVDEIGKFYYGDPYSISQNEPKTDTKHLGWSGYTLKRGNNLHFIVQAIELDGEGMITNPEILGTNSGLGSLGTLYINVGENSVSFTLESLGKRIDEPTASAVSAVIVIDIDGTILHLYNNKTDRSTIVTLQPGQALWTGKYLDRSNGIDFGLGSHFNENDKVIVTKYNVK